MDGLMAQRFLPLGSLAALNKKLRISVLLSLIEVEQGLDVSSAPLSGIS